MFHQLFDASNVPVLQEVVYFTQARHEVLAGNVANISTPGYRVRDLSEENFQTSLREAIDRSKETRRPLSPGMASQSSPGSDLREVRESSRGILYHDGSDVSMEKQVMELTKNQLTHNLAISLLQSQFRTLQMAISERISV